MRKPGCIGRPKRESENRAAPHGTIDSDFSPMSLDDVFCNRQTKPRATAALLAGSPEKLLKNPVNVLAWDSCAVVADRQFNPFIDALTAEDQAARLAAEE